MAYDIGFVQLHDTHVVDDADPAGSIAQAAAAPRRKIYLRDVPIEHHLRARAQSREEHLELIGGGILRFVENHEGVVERTTAHVGERRHFDRTALEIARDHAAVEQ